ncbi:ABC transporter substrate-binding protein [candidate division KSB3 bacterium]|uniref:ABC transporter substrate-binding protein n=1 Tax=candidate division KSB3 bacterium TaxID=2044937 RepID=A0A9D5JSK3_9BACT|nr:ABC transporter substrate-binding protein [candidate division KSB3 bacterium]MBD3323227.1 ABC transporter substrate-binding protein [candidate division KSB3 bacterium]
MKNSRTWIVAVALVSLCTWTGVAMGADPITVNALGGFTQQVQSTLVEQPFFKELDEASAELDIQFRTMDELGQKGFQAMRQLRAGVFDIMEIQLGYVSGDDPFFQGVDLVGVSPDIDTAREVMEAFREEFDQRLQEKFDGKLLALWPYGDQVFWFKEKINGLDDFKGKKIRVFSRPMASFVEYFGATGVSMAFPEVYTSMQRGVIDGAVTGALAGNTASWFEVANYVYPMPVSFSMQAHVANLNFWNGLEPEMQEFLTQKFREMEDKLWEIGAQATQDGINCNIGEEPCEYGKKGSMELIPVSAEDKERMKEAVESVILPEWAQSADKITVGSSDIWNETAGEAAGVTITY